MKKELHLEDEILRHEQMLATLEPGSDEYLAVAESLQKLQQMRWYDKKSDLDGTAKAISTGCDVVSTAAGVFSSVGSLWMFGKVASAVTSVEEDGVITSKLYAFLPGFVSRMLK